MELIDDKLQVTTSDGVIKEIIIDPEDFSIDEANVEGELCRAGVLLCYYADLVAELEAKSSTLKNRLGEMSAAVAITLRAGPTKVTQGMVDDYLYTDVTINTMRDSLVNAQKQTLKASNLFRSMNQKVECLKALAYRQNKQEKLF